MYRTPELRNPRPTIKENLRLIVTQAAYGLEFSYEFQGYVPHVRKDGGRTELSVWNGTCVVCGAAFECRSTKSPGSLPRACHEHRPWIAHTKDDKALKARKKAIWLKRARGRRGK